MPRFVRYSVPSPPSILSNNTFHKQWHFSCLRYISEYTCPSNADVLSKILMRWLAQVLSLSWVWVRYLLLSNTGFTSVEGELGGLFSDGLWEESIRKTSFSFQGAETVKRLLDMAIDAVPPYLWKNTPVVLKATAGLRLLSEEKAQALLLEVILRSFGCTSIALLFHLSWLSSPFYLAEENFSCQKWL